jgi:hypothetical protein
MAQIWSELSPGDVEQGQRPWGIITLDDSLEAMLLTGEASGPLERVDGDHTGGGAYLLRHDAGDGASKWILYAGPEASVAVNGMPLALGMRALRDRDEISMGRSCHLIFTSDSIPHVTAFSAAGEPIVCPRCAGRIEPEQLAVRCPQCGVWHHQDDSAQRLCWTYGPMCTACGNQATPLDGEVLWTPEGL